MKTLDPQSALLTTAEVYSFFNTNPPRPQDKPSGSYKPVDLRGYHDIRNDFDEYTRVAVPYVRSYPAPETYLYKLASQLHQLGLTKTEAVMLIDLGIGLDPAQSEKLRDTTEVNGERPQDGARDAKLSDGGTAEVDYAQKISLIVEESQDRFPGIEGEHKIQQILQLLKDCQHTSMGVNKHDAASENGIQNPT